MRDRCASSLSTIKTFWLVIKWKYLVLAFLLHLNNFCLSAQSTKYSRMTSVTNSLIHSLKTCDTTSILNLYDTSFSHINNKHYRDWTREEIQIFCGRFNKVVNKYGAPSLSKLTFIKDSTNGGANIAVLPLMEKNDSALNLKKSTLYVMFYPDEFFKENKLLRFVVFNEDLTKKPERPLIQPHN
jgi:hypothetical protein